MLCRVVYRSFAGGRPSAPDVAVLIANSESTVGRDLMSMTTALCRDTGVTLVVVAADRVVWDSTELRSVVSAPTERNYFSAPSLSALRNVTQSVLPAVLLCPGFHFNCSDSEQITSGNQIIGNLADCL